MPNLNAALGLSQLKKLPFLLEQKRLIAKKYKDWGDKNGYCFMQERSGTVSNYWLNTMIVNDKEERDAILEETNKSLVMTRPAWTPMHRLPFNTSFQRDEMTNTDWLFDRIINVPSGVPKNGT
jgi:dTDP-4-amino-4,6-dideoxygalactose transaminase